MGGDTLMTSETFVDPPSGWRYGFPRKYSASVDGGLREFLIHHGYPEDDIDFALSYIRFFEVPKNKS